MGGCQNKAPIETNEEKREPAPQIVEVFQKRIRIGDVAPNFKADTTMGPFELHKFMEGSWMILFSHPACFTPVCTTELGEVSKLMPEFKKRNVVVSGLSVDPVEPTMKWMDDINKTQNTTLTYPIICDTSRKIAALYDMLDQTNLDTISGLPATVRSVFIIDAKKVIRWMITYPASCGRNFDEILRCIDSLQLTDVNKTATPVNWTQKEDVIIQTVVKDEDAKQLFGEFRTVMPYLRYVRIDQCKKAPRVGEESTKVEPKTEPLKEKTETIEQPKEIRKDGKEEETNIALHKVEDQPK